MEELARKAAGADVKLTSVKQRRLDMGGLIRVFSGLREELENKGVKFLLETGAEEVERHTI